MRGHTWFPPKRSKMPDNRRIQGPEESFCPLLYLRDEDRHSKKPLVSDDGERLDGRTHNELRPMFMNNGVNPHATGSAYLEMGKTKILCTIYGPKEGARREEFTANGRLVCDFKFAPFSCLQRRQYQQDAEEKDYSSIIAQALKRCVKLEAFPKLQLEINIMVLENGGSALASSIVCASLALAETGLELYDLPVACSLVVHESGQLIDPSVEEEYTNDEVIRHPSISGIMTVVYLPSMEEVTGFKQTGVMDQQDVSKGLDMCIGGCLRVHHKMREFLTSEQQSLTADPLDLDSVMSS